MNENLLFEPFILRALWAGCAIGAATAALGCFIVWRKSAYFGDALAHSALLGAPLGFAFGIDAGYSVILICVLFAVLFSYLQSKRILGNDTALGILAHTSLSAALIMIGLLKIPNFDLHGFLFGDILTVTREDLPLISAGALITLGVLFRYRREFTLMTVSEELAGAEGVAVKRLNFLLTLLTALLIGLSVRIVGVLLVTALLLIPAAGARFFAHSPSAMIVRAMLLSVVSVVTGMIASIYMNSPAGPAIILTATGLFVILFFAETILKKNR